MSGTLTRDSGARLVTAGDLEQIETPSPTETWYPAAHSQVLQAATGTLEKAGFEIAKMQLAVSPDDTRFFGVLDLKSEVCDGVMLAVGIRNSLDKSFPLGFCCGERVFTCDNLAFAADIVLSCRHTRHGADRYMDGITNAVYSLHGYKIGAQKRVEAFQEMEISEDRANSLILQSYRQGIVGARLLPKICEAWEDGREDQTVWSLLNSFTHAYKPRFAARPHEAAQETIRLQRFLEEANHGSHGTAS